jgi:hypothetical protein
MNAAIIDLFNEGDFHFKEAKAQFLNNQEEQCDATCHGCKAMKSYLDAYMLSFNDHYKQTDNYHILVRTLLRYDPDFERFYNAIFDIKCFAEESHHNKDNFFLFDIEVNKALHTLEDVRNYIASKVHFEKKFLEDYSGSSLTGT